MTQESTNYTIHGIHGVIRISCSDIEFCRISSTAVQQEKALECSYSLYFYSFITKCKHEKENPVVMNDVKITFFYILKRLKN